MFCLFLGWILPLQAGRHSRDSMQLVAWSSDQYPDKGSRRYSDSSATSGRRYPPRQTETYDNRRPAPERRGNYQGNRAPYSSSSQGSRGSTANRSGRRRQDSTHDTHQDTTLDDAISRVRRQSDGRVLSAETVRSNDRDEHRVRVITDDGRVRRYRMDAETGNLLPRGR